MTPEMRRELSSRGGSAPHEDRPTAFKDGSRRAKLLGRKGGSRKKKPAI